MKCTDITQPSVWAALIWLANLLSHVEFSWSSCQLTPADEFVPISIFSFNKVIRIPATKTSTPCKVCYVNGEIMKRKKCLSQYIVINLHKGVRANRLIVTNHFHIITAIRIGLILASICAREVVTHSIVMLFEASKCHWVCEIHLTDKMPCWTLNGSCLMLTVSSV